jgi:hypothetical protein
MIEKLIAKKIADEDSKDMAKMCQLLDDTSN